MFKNQFNFHNPNGVTQGDFVSAESWPALELWPRLCHDMEMIDLSDCKVGASNKRQSISRGEMALVVELSKPGNKFAFILLNDGRSGWVFSTCLVPIMKLDRHL